MKKIILAIMSVLFIFNSNNLEASDAKFRYYVGKGYGPNPNSLISEVIKSKKIPAYLFVATVMGGKWKVFYSGLVKDGHIADGMGGNKALYHIPLNSKRFGFPDRFSNPDRLPKEKKAKYPGRKVYAYLWSYENGKWSSPIVKSDKTVYTKSALKYFRDNL